MSPASLEERVEAAAAEYLQAVDAGSAPSKDEYLARYPDLAAELSEFLDDLARFRVVSTPRAASDTPADPGPAATATFDGSATVELPDAPVRIPDHDLISELGRGGMGVVYKVRQISLNRLVALKTIAPDRLEGRFERERFLREAEAAAALDHPNIVPIYDVGEADGRSYFTMKLVDGGSLADLLGKSPRADVRGRVSLLVRVARAVHYAHQRGILHRDLKPSNILLGPAGEPLVADFGLAKRLGGPSDVSKSGVIVGTPSYIAPEQARGQKGVSTAADVYGLGAILYELLTGRPPFRAASAAETLVLVLTGVLARPRTLNAAVPVDLEAICLKCLANEPDGRYGSAEALAVDLDRWLKGEPTAARPARAAERVRKWMRRNPAVTALITLGFVAIGAVIGAAVALGYNARLADAKGQLEEANDGLQEANNARAAALAELEGKNAEAERHKAEADAERENAEALLYVARFRQAGEAWQDGRPALAATLLYDGPEVARLRRFAGVEESLSGIGRVQVRPLRVPWAKPRQFETAEPTQTIRLADLSADGRTAVLAHPDESVSWWDTESGERLGRVTLERFRTIAGLRMTPTRTVVLVSVPGPSEVRVAGDCWSGAPAEVVGLPKGLAARFVEQVPLRVEVPGNRAAPNWCVSRDGSRLAVTESDGRLRVWAVRDGSPVTDIRGFGTDPAPVALSADGSRAVRGGAAPAVWRIGTTGREWLLPIRDTGAAWRAVAFSPDGKIIAAATDTALELWTADSGTFLHTVGLQSGVTDLEFGPDGQSILAIEADRRATVWGLWGRPLAAFVPDRAPLFRARPAAGAMVVAAGGRNHPLDMYFVRFGRAEAAVISLPESPHSLAFSSDGQRVAATLKDGSVGVWWAADGHPICTLKAPENRFGFSRASFSPDGRCVAVGSAHDVVICDAADGQVLSKLPAEMKSGMAYIYDVAFSPDGNFVAAGTAHTATVWDLRTGVIVHRFQEKPPPGMPLSSWMIAVRFSPDGNFLATGSGSWDSDGTGRAVGYVGVWDLQTSRQVFLSPGQPDGIYGLAWSPDSRRLASGSGRYQFGGPGGVHVWEPASGRVLFDLKGHTQCVWAVAFSPDGRRLVSAGGPWRSPYPGQDRRQKIPHGAAEVRVWDMGSGQELLSTGLHTATVYGVAFTPDGKSFATAGWDKLVRVWNIEPNAATAASRPRP